MAGGDFLLHEKDQRIALAVDADILYDFDVAAGLALHHESALGPAEHMDFAGFERLFDGLAGHVTQYEAAGAYCHRR